jgi:hypothetical protein
MNYRFFALILVVEGMYYHHAGQNDWFALTTIPDNLSPSQIGNEIISAIALTGAMIIMALHPFRSKTDNQAGR